MQEVAAAAAAAAAAATTMPNSSIDICNDDACKK